MALFSDPKSDGRPKRHSLRSKYPEHSRDWWLACPLFVYPVVEAPYVLLNLLSFAGLCLPGLVLPAQAAGNTGMDHLGLADDRARGYSACRLTSSTSPTSSQERCFFSSASWSSSRPDELQLILRSLGEFHDGVRALLGDAVSLVLGPLSHFHSTVVLLSNIAAATSALGGGVYLAGALVTAVFLLPTYLKFGSGTRHRRHALP